jgi:nitric oxide reductase NorE protein
MNIAATLPLPHDRRQGLPGDLAMWFFIFAELLVFGVLFLAYAFARARNVELFNASQLELNRLSGAVNTALLITSSYFVVFAVNRIRYGHSRACARWLIAAIACGGAFLAVKLSEFSAKVEAGINMSTNTFYMFPGPGYHFMHGVGMIILVCARARHGSLPPSTPA